MTQTQPLSTGLDPTFNTAVQNMIAASGGKLYIESGYRSEQEQAALYAAAVQKYGAAGAGKWVAPPGKSNHNRGLAVDLGGDIELAHQLAPQFGLTFPMSWEPWHIEPVHARETSDPQAYTDPPPGETNPTADPTLSQQPEFVAASLANAMQAALDPTTAGPIGEGGGSSAPTTATSTTPTTAEGGVAPDQLYAALRGQGLPAAAAAAFVSIASRESSYNPSAHNDNPATGDDSYGLFQVNLLNGGWAPYLEEHGMKDPATALRTVQGSVEAAKLLYDHSGLEPWGGYKGASWNHGVTAQGMQTGIDASGGEVTMNDLQGLK